MVEANRLTSQSAGARPLTWEPNNRLATLNNGSSTETYGYDPLDHRIQRSGGALGSATTTSNGIYEALMKLATNFAVERPS